MSEIIQVPQINLSEIEALPSQISPPAGRYNIELTLKPVKLTSGDISIVSEYVIVDTSELDDALVNDDGSKVTVGQRWAEFHGLKSTPLSESTTVSQLQLFKTYLGSLETALGTTFADVGEAVAAVNKLRGEVIVRYRENKTNPSAPYVYSKFVGLV